MNNLKEIKTTIIGILLISGSVYNYLWQDQATWQTLVVFCFGVAFLFFPDSILTSIKRVFIRKSKEI